MTAFTELQPDDWMDRDNAVQRQRPVLQADPAVRLLGFRTDGVRVVSALAWQYGRRLKVVRRPETTDTL
ncbi:hypothetical protein [Streptomyces virginiae]|uniref:UbiC transcription regulator-associated domain-containing protein n=1 Tax=Streptomyces virginiae TaxID=1961 RepID=A0ABZ1TNU9_STRVG|nr:hypothetical protein [Streptomyces virginiae]